MQDRGHGVVEVSCDRTDRNSGNRRNIHCVSKNSGPLW